jgi:CheY-like chemotaxis protein
MVGRCVIKTAVMENELTEKTLSKPRIVLIDDEEWLQDMVELAIRGYFKDFSLFKFRNRNEGWQELLRADPDLLITDLRNDNVPTIPGSTKEDLGMSGFDLLGLLAARQVKYPVLVISGSLSISGMEGLAKKCAGPNLKVSYLTKPFTTELFYQGLLKCLGPNSHSGFTA